MIRKLRYWAVLSKAGFLLADTLGDYDCAWTRFLTLIGEPDNEKSRKAWRKKGFRRVKIYCTFEWELPVGIR